MKSDKFSWTLLITMLLVGLTMVAIVPMINVASANPETHFFVDPPEVRNKMPEDLFLIHINVTEAPETYAWEIYISWNKTLMDVIYILEGDFLSDQGSTSFSYIPFDEANDAGQIVVGCSLIGDPGSVTWASGDGWLFNLGFNVTALGSCVLDLFKTRLYDHVEAGYPAFTYYPNQDCFFYNTLFHDIAVDNVAPDVPEANVGESVTIDVTVTNEGNYSETFNVAVYADATVYNKSVGWWPDKILVGDEITIDTYSVTNLAEGATNTTTVSWNTTGLAAETYTISATVTLTSPADDDSRDNMFIDGTVKFLVDHDLKVTDVTILTPEVLMGELANMTVNVENQGTNSESFTLYVNASGSGSTIYTNSTSLSAGANSTFNISWNTAGVAGEAYTISAYVPPVTGEREVDKADNTRVDGEVTVRWDHDLKIAGVTVLTPEVLRGELANMAVTVLNEGTNPETYTLYVRANETTIETIDSIGSLGARGGSNTHDISWDTAGAELNGTYTISAYVSPVSGEVDPNIADNTFIDGTVTVTAHLGAHPVADFTYSYSREKPLVNEEVTFNARASTPSARADIVSYEWDFDDGTTEIYVGANFTAIANHTYTTFGNYTVTLNVTDSENLSNSTSKPIEVCVLPVAFFTYSPEDPMRGETVTFDATDSYDPDGNITYRHWDFGDGVLKSVTDPIITHKYTTVGDYSVTLTVQDDDMLPSDTTVFNVTVFPARDIAITNVTASPTQVMVGQPVSINVTSRNGGDEEQVFTVTVYYGDTAIANQTDITLATGITTTLPFTWDTAGVDPGTYTIKAIAKTVKREINATNNEFIGGAVTVKLSSTVSISTYPATIDVGANTTINGAISPIRQEVNVTIQYRLSGETEWNTLSTVKTDSTGSYEYTWTPETAGTYEVKAKWPGDEITLAAESDIKTVKVRGAAPAPDILAYAAVGIVIIIAAAVAIYVIKFRKPA